MRISYLGLLFQQHCKSGRKGVQLGLEFPAYVHAGAFTMRFDLQSLLTNESFHSPGLRQFALNK
jgi:hypothetical protein